MAFIFPALLIVVFLFCLAFSYREGMWGNAVTLINVIVAALLATSFWEPVARLLEGWMPSFTFFLDMISIWLLFCVFLVIFRTATRGVSKYKVRFKQLHEQIGSVVFAMLLGFVMVCFTTMTLHTAPLGRNFLFGGFKCDPPGQKNLFGAAPDILWLSFVKMTSKGSLKRWNTREFDPGNEFIVTYADRRATLEASAEQYGSFRVPADQIGGDIPQR